MLEGPFRLPAVPPALRRLAVSPMLVGLAVFTVYVVWLAQLLRGGHHLHEFIHISPNFWSGSTASPAIVNGPVQPDGSPGFDGQFAYEVAVDPGRAHFYMDFPSYRMERVAYPLAARAFAVGHSAWVPTTLVLVNLLAIAAGTAALAAWLRKRDLPPWLALVYGLAPANLFSLKLDTVDASAMAVVAVALWLLDLSLPLAAVAFAVAGLTKETALVFPVVLLGVEAISRRRSWPQVLRAGSIAVLPAVAWKLWLWHWLGRSEMALSYNFTAVPFGGVSWWLQHMNSDSLPEVAAVFVPGVVVLGVALWELVRGRSPIMPAVAAAVIAVSLAFAWRFPLDGYGNAARTTVGITLASLLLLPQLVQRGWWWLCAGLWLGPLPALLLTPTP